MLSLASDREMSLVKGNRLQECNEALSPRVGVTPRPYARHPSNATCQSGNC